MFVQQQPYQMLQKMKNQLLEQEDTPAHLPAALR
jgi:hypothetical protein